MPTVSWTLPEILELQLWDRSNLYSRKQNHKSMPLNKTFYSTTKAKMKVKNVLGKAAKSWHFIFCGGIQRGYSLWQLQWQYGNSLYQLAGLGATLIQRQLGIVFDPQKTKVESWVHHFKSGFVLNILSTVDTSYKTFIDIFFSPRVLPSLLPSVVASAHLKTVVLPQFSNKRRRWENARCFCVLWRISPEN